jgi:hypothetical protein
MIQWKISGEPEVFDRPEGRDAYGYKWPLERRDGACLFTMVYVSAHANGGSFSDCTPDRAIRAATTNGRSEVERYLDLELPPRLIEVGTGGNPVVTAPRT